MKPGEKDFLTTEEFLKYAAMSERTLRRRVADGGLSPIKTKRGLLFHYTQLPDDKARKAFLLDQGLLPEATAEPEKPGNREPWRKKIALERKAIVEEWKRVEQNTLPGKKGQVQKIIAGKHNRSALTLRRYIRDYDRGGLGALEPEWNPGGKCVLTKEIKQATHDIYMKLHGPSVRETYERICVAFKDKGPLPTYRTLAAHIKKTYPEGIQLLIRDPEAYNRKYSAHVPRSRPEKVNDLCYSDHKQLDIVIRHRGKAVRPWITIFLDAHSGKIVGSAVTITPDADAIAQAFVRAVRGHGLPKAIYIDRGKSYKSFKITGQKIKVETIHPPEDSKIERIAGLFGEMGVEVIWAAPYNAKEKGAIEATGNYFTSRMRGWLGFCGHNTKTRPKNLEALIKSGKLLTLKELSAKIDELIHDRNARPHSTTGKIPNDCYKGFTPPIPTEDVLAFLLMDVHQCKVRSSAVKIRETMYRHEDLWQLNGVTAEVRRDPQDLRRAAIIYNGEVFCIAPEIQVGDYASPLTKENVKMARRIKRSESQFRKKHIEQGGYINDPLELATHLSEKEQEIEVIPRVQKAKVTSLHRKERLARKVAEGLRDAPSKTRGQGKVARLPKDDRREQILGAFFGD